MQLQRWQILSARLFFFAYVLFTATYCLLAYVPFTYQQIHVGQLLPWLTALVGWQALLFWPAFVAVLLTIIPALKGGPACYLARSFAAAGGLAGIVLLFHPLLPHLRNDFGSFVLSVLTLASLAWLAAIDLLQGFGPLLWVAETATSDSKLFFAAAGSAIFVSSIFFLTTLERLLADHKEIGDISRLALTWFSSLLSHSLIFFLIFVACDLAMLFGAVVASGQVRAKVTSILSACVVGMLFICAVRYVILPPFSLGSSNSLLVAIAVASSVMLFIIGTSIRMWDSSFGPLESGIDLLLVPFFLLRRTSKLKQMLVVGGMALIAWLLSVRASRMDWEFLLQKITALLIWALTFAIFYTLTPRWRSFSRAWAYAAGLVILVLYVGINERPKSVAYSTNALLSPSQFQNYDISFRLADGILQSPLGSQNSSAAPFYSFLAQNTNIPRSTRLTPVDIHLVERLHSASGKRPNIFVIVIDSLRRDYLSPYDSSVKFTPEIGRFARDSVVFESAFTRYGGTGLSEPSIWVGGLIPHQQYTEPFAPMNSLQKLLESNHYREWVSKDNVLQQVVPASPNIDELDKDIGAMSYDLCRTLQEVTDRLPSSLGGDPIFVYTQAQNIHVSVIDREGRSVPSGVTFPAGFDGAYASRLQRIDHCLGNFFQSLKKNQLYDQSIIVLTSDHGDSLGEGGRWGHAYTIFPEIVRVPLIIHLPTGQDHLQFVPQSLAFLTDITPSLYYLLGQQPVTNNPILGRPLFTRSIEEQRPYLRDAYVIVSSYAPVYGLLTQHGQRLYIADGVNYRDYAYAIDPAASSREISLSEDERTSAQSQIRDQVNAIARFYGVQQ